MKNIMNLLVAMKLSIKHSINQEEKVLKIESIYMILGEIYPNAPDFMSPDFE